MAQAANIIQYVQIGFGRQMQAYGAWYEGEQQEDYYKTQAGATQWEKQNLYRETEAAAERDVRAAGALQLEAKNAQYEAEQVRRASAISEQKHRDISDSGMARGAARLAKSGVDINYGSPMEFLNQAAEERARDFGIEKWKNEMNVWAAERKVQGLQDKATIMLDQAALRRWQYRNAAYMLDYQTLLYNNAAKEAKKAAKYKEISHYIGAFTDSLNVQFGKGKGKGNSGGGDMFGDMFGGGGSGGGMDTSSMGSFDAGGAGSIA